MMLFHCFMQVTIHSVHPTLFSIALLQANASCPLLDIIALSLRPIDFCESFERLPSDPLVVFGFQEFCLVIFVDVVFSSLFMSILNF